MTVTILQGDALAVLKGMDAESVDCVVTSPPYWGLRDYGVAGQMGLEQTLGEHIAAMVEVFAEVHRVLKPTGTCWVNYGDVWASSVNGRSNLETRRDRKDDRSFTNKPFSTVQGWFKEKDRIFAGTMLAMALQKDGWWCRDRIIWHKPNPMPSSVKDRCGNAYEEIYLLAKSKRYYFDYEAIMEESTWPDHPRNVDSQYEAPGQSKHTGLRKTGLAKRAQTPVAGWATGSADHSVIAHNRGDRKQRKRGVTPKHEGHIQNETLDGYPRGQGRMKRNVWTIATRPFPEAHFATFPPELAEICIKAGCPEGGTVLDPFGGAGTTALVADRLGRDCTLIELNPEYIEIARQRIKGDCPMFTEVA